MNQTAAPVVFRAYDQAALDAQYDNRAKVPAFPDYLARYRARSDAARARFAQSARLDVAVGTTPIEAIDIFPAATSSPAPVLVFIHGGYWQMLDKVDFDYIANGFVPHGIATVVLNYALIPAVRMAEQVRQCRQAVAWVIDHAASFGADPSRVAICGHSAGGHLTAMVGTTDWSSFRAARVPQPIAHRPLAGYSLSGLHDLEPIRCSYLQKGLALDDDEVAAFSPMRLAPPTDGAWYAIVGAKEGPEYERQATELAANWRARGCRETGAEIVNGHDHFSIAMALDDPHDPLTRRIADDVLARRPAAG